MMARATALLTAAGLASAASASITVSSTFDTNTDGWLLTGDGTGLTWTDAGGNPDGFIEARDRGAGSIWGFAAPAKFLGDKSAFVGGMLQWDLIELASPGSPNNHPDVTLFGSGMTIVVDAGENPATTWTSYSVPLSTDADWRMGSLNGSVVTEEQFEMVLASLTGMVIRGEFRSVGGDRSGLDNVVMIPAPASLAMLGAAGLAATRRRRG